jgi:hypothetical protein
VRFPAVRSAGAWAAAAVLTEAACTNRNPRQNSGSWRRRRGVERVRTECASLLGAQGQAGQAARWQGAIHQGSYSNGPVLKVGMEDERVPRLRERLGIHGDSMTFDASPLKAICDLSQRS